MKSDMSKLWGRRQGVRDAAKLAREAAEIEEERRVKEVEKVVIAQLDKEAQYDTRPKTFLPGVIGEFRITPQFWQYLNMCALCSRPKSTHTACTWTCNACLLKLEVFPGYETNGVTARCVHCGVVRRTRDLEYRAFRDPYGTRSTYWVLKNSTDGFDKESKFFSGFVDLDYAEGLELDELAASFLLTRRGVAPSIELDNVLRERVRIAEQQEVIALAKRKP